MKKKSLKVSNQLPELEKIVLFLEALSVEWQVPMKINMELNLVIEELFTNIVFYAFDDDLPHPVTLEMEMPAEKTIIIRISDEGKPFNLLEKSTDELVNQSLEERKIGGLGIHFVKEMMSRVEYQRKNDKNIVILTKKY